jgi:MraZ protein
VFRGINAINIDPKGRMAIPTRYRQQLEESCQGRLILTIDTDERCLLLYSLPEWEKIEQKIAVLPSFNKAARRVQRLLIGYATEAELDSNGRILLPTLLREYAGIDKRLMMIGQGKKFELWDDGQWTARRENWLKEDNDVEEALPLELQALSL